jgi:hypothetical protein
MPTYTLNKIVYTYTAGPGNPASVTGFEGGITTANILSSFSVSSVTYNVTSIGSAAFQSCATLTSVTIPNSVTSIAINGFQNCSNLTSASLGNSIVSLGAYAFESCSNLTSISFPNTLTTISGEACFRFCTNLVSASLGNSLTSIPQATFNSCSKLSSITIPNSVTSIGLGAFQSCTLLASVSLGNSVTSIENSAFQSCTSLTSITLPNSITGLGPDAFASCTNLVSATLPTNASFTTINVGVFISCSKLSSITIPNSVTIIGDYAFQNCTALNYLTIGNSVTIIGTNVFQNCTSLTSITIPSSVTNIGLDAFYNCSSLNIVYFLRTPVLPTLGASVFDYISASSVGKYYSTVTDTTPIAPPVFNSISTISNSAPTLTSITPPFPGTPTRLSVISYNDLATNGNESVTNLPYVFLVNAVLSGSLSIGPTQASARPWNATTNKIIYDGNNAYWTSPDNISGVLNAFSVVIQDAVGALTSPNVDVQVNVPYPCFLEGTKILCFESNKEVYRPIESLRKGDLVKTTYNGYIPIYMIGTSTIYNPGNDYRVANRLYKCPKEKYPALFEDLYITGCHSILVPSMTDDEWENTKAVNGNVFVTDNHFRLLACADEKAEPFNKEGFMNIYHIALENNDYYMNYGVYANGLLVESCSKRYLTELSNMRILGQEDSAVSQNVDKLPFNNMGQLVDIY